MTISQGTVKLENLIQRDKDLEKMVELLERNLIKKGAKKYLISIVRPQHFTHQSIFFLLTFIASCFRKAWNVVDK